MFELGNKAKPTWNGPWPFKPNVCVRPIQIRSPIL